MPTRSVRPDLLTVARSSANEGTRERAREAIGLQISIFAFVLVALIALPVFGFRPAPIAGAGSLGQFAAVSAAATAAVVFVLGRIVVAEPQRRERLAALDLVDVAALAFAHAVIALLGWTLVAVILEAGLIGAVVFPLPVLLLSGAAAALTAYVVFVSATHLDLQLLAVVLALFLVVGVLASMLTASDPTWWKDNLSALGMTDDLSARTFNLTLIIAGILVTTLARYATNAIPGQSGRGVVAVRTCLIIVGVFLGMVGLFPVDQYFALHTGVASGMAVAFGVLVVGLKWWLPGVSRTFLSIGYLFIAVIVLHAVLFATGYYTLTAVELVAGVVVFAWIILLIRTVAALAQDASAADAVSDASEAAERTAS
ncbi:DUF998 domain-containing protein [Microbacterium esteraromaticum]|uniref:DUF998 domain-containing protein n=1 Tax=Microbacterium esteraromaticum TaxID=57043 RepID=A0A939ITH7_9MICO|nr:DUF998 domain-containing protein [Microbacterium esteraromaticum]MBN7792462.1 DUF998 domain-containing protein [Microbacterium esteraromaticum]MBN8206257.1 DUF998 domain-containing protein [Microbacterium esteraromaticum]MBN8416412.1 DUF998 domain-containing protein [Microbacterium esteraromaticum]MBN8423229.1 DUF998 domain-containing protein [Microbacterium esteraromaticum]MCA1306427.1 DUF998 domain-containing protein [Microbacterium esteraromaticum]